MDYNPPGSSARGILRKNTGVGCQALLQGISSTQGRLIMLNHQGSLKVDRPSAVNI